VKIAYETPITLLREQARALGERTFMSPVPCRHGHTAPRETSNGQCSECKQSIRTGRKDAHKQYARGWHELHHEKQNRRSAEWRDQNKERCSRTGRAYRIAHHDSCVARSRRWKLANPDLVRANWNRANARRRVLKANASHGDRRSYQAYTRWVAMVAKIRCYWCHKPTTRKTRHMDHIIPLAKGGSHSVGNLCVACVHCNCSKKALLPHEFADQAELHLA
jgi:hypothetical protein